MASYFGRIEILRGMQNELTGDEVDNVYKLINKEIELIYSSGEREFSFELKKEIPNEVLNFYLGVGFDISNTKHFINNEDVLYEYKFSKIINKERGNYTKRTIEETYLELLT